MFRFLACIIKNKSNYIKFTAFLISAAMLSSFLFSCKNVDISTDTENTVIEEQSVSDLYENAGAAERILPRDPFNLLLSHNNYFYSETVSVEITSDIKDAVIYYTFDSSIPSKDNVSTSQRNGVITGSREYTEPITLEATDNNTPYVLKIIAYSEERISRVITHTYFVSSDIDKRFDENIFVFAISSEPDNLYSYETGILVEGKLRAEWHKANPGKSPDPPEPANYNLRGFEGERESYLEVFKSDGQLLISQGIGIRVHGAWSRAADRKSLRLYARDSYDIVFDRFYYPFFDENRRNDEYGSYIQDYKTLLLRNGANDRGSSFMREEFAQGLAKKAEFIDYREYAPAAVFLNGEYYGFFWLQHIYNEDYFMDNYGGDNKELYDIVDYWDEPQLGDMLSEDVFKKTSELYDLDNFMQYYAFQIYSQNWDWPHNNRKLWRYNADGGTYINQYYDGKLRMLLYDDEGAWGDWAGTSEMTIQRIKGDGSAPVFTALIKRKDMQEKFCNQMFDLFNSVFLYDSIQEEHDKIVGLYDYEIGIAVRKNVLPNSARNIENSRKSILRFAKRREMYVIEDMKQSFSLNGNIYNVNVKNKPNADISLNTLKLGGSGDLKSYYFTEHSVILKAEPNPGYLFDYWEINGKQYQEHEIKLNNSIAVNGVINAELFIKPDENYHDIVIQTVQLDSNRDIITLHNPGANEIVVKDLYLSNDKTELKKFHIKKVRFYTNSIMTYYGKNYTAKPEEKIKSHHIFDFKIQKGETIYLSDKNGNILQELYIPESLNIDKNEEISRESDGSYKINKIEAVK